MDPSLIINISMSMAVLLIFILITVRLIKRMREKKISNLKWLIIFFIGQSVVGFTRMMYFDLGFYIIEIIVLLSLIIFTKETFYKKQQSAFIPIFISEIVLLSFNFAFVIIRLIFRNIGDTHAYNMFYILDMNLLGFSTMLASLWYASASFSAYIIAKEQNFDKITTLRYKILGISALFLTIMGFVFTIHAPITTFYRDLVEIRIFTLINVTTTLLFAVGNYYAWVILGKKIEKSRVQLPSEEDLSEEEITRMFKKEG